MGTSLITRSFGGGELAPVLHARADQAKYTQGLRTCRNFLVRREGGVSNRAGFRFVTAAKTNDAGTRLMPFVGPTVNESCAIEMGAGYFRFIKDGALVRVTGVPAFDADTTYLPGDLVTDGGITYYCIGDTTGAATLHRLPVDEFNAIADWAGYSDTPSLGPFLSTCAGHDGTDAVRVTWRRNPLGDPFCWITKTPTAPLDLTAYADTTAVTDAALLAPWVRPVSGNTIYRVRIYLVTADWSPSDIPVYGSPSVNTSGYSLDLDAAQLRIGTPAAGMWFQPALGTGAAITRGDWTPWGTPDWATVQGIFVQVFATGGDIEFDVDDLALTETVSGPRLPTPEPPDAAYWYALTDDIYEIPTPYPLSALPFWDQSGNVLVLTHHDYAPRELVYQTETRWILRLAGTEPTIGPPTDVTGTAGVAGTSTRRYVVSSVKADTYEESYPSAVCEIPNAAEPTPDHPDVLAWTAVPGAAESYVYCDPGESGTFGYVGTATGVAGFSVTGVVPVDFLWTPQRPGPSFTAPGSYPARSAHYQQRRWYANTKDEPDRIDGSRTGFPNNFSVSRPLQDDDAITVRISGNLNHPVRWLVGLKSGLIVGTDGGEWTLTGGSGPYTAITPSSIDVRQETYAGVAPEVRPVVVGSAILYLQARGNIFRDIQYDQQVQGLAGRDLTVWATHLFERRVVLADEYQQVPNTIVWCVRDDGTLLGLTYLPDQEIWGWHRHDTAGLFEEVCVVPEDDEDVLYVLVSRTIGGSAKRYIERLERREIRTGYESADSFFVDSGLSYSGAATNTFTGLDHLEGKVVAMMGDGAVVFNGDPASAQATYFTVRGGTIHTAAPYSLAHVGLPIRYAEIETLDLDIQGSAIRDKKKRVGSLTVLLERSARAFSAGVDATHLRPFSVQTWEGSAVLYTGQCELGLTSQFDHYGRTLIRVTDPVPVTILAVIPNVEVGG